MTNSHNATPTKCFSGILRRLLCTGSLPTHPSDSDHVPESDESTFNYTTKMFDEAKGVSSTPGVVARLMGLDSLPDTKWTPRDSTHFRSRSVNSADYFHKFDQTQELQHRRVRTSVSFREIPTFLNPQNQDFFVVCFDNGDENNGFGLKMIEDHKVVGFQEMKKKVKKTSKSTTSVIFREKLVVKKKQNQQNNKRNLEKGKRNSSKVNEISPHYNKSNDVYVKSSSYMKMKSQEKSVKNLTMNREIRRRAKKVEHDLGSSNSSSEPVSSVSGNSRTMSLNPTKKYSTPKVEKFEDYPCTSPLRKSNPADEQQQIPEAIQFTKHEKLMKTREIDFFIKKFVEIYKQTEEDTKGSNDSKWIVSTEVIKFEDFEDICFEFGNEILEMLLQQVVDELC